MRTITSCTVPISLLTTLFALTVFGADPTSNSKFVIPLFRYAPPETSTMWIQNRGEAAIPVEVSVLGRDLSNARDIADPIGLTLGEVPAGKTRSFTSTQLIEADEGKDLSLTYNYEFSLTMILAGSDVFVRTGIQDQELGLIMVGDAVRTYSIDGAPAMPGGKVRFTIPIMPHRRLVQSRLLIFNGGSLDTRVDVEITGSDVTNPSDPQDIEPASVSLDTVPRGVNREFTSADLLEKIPLTSEKDYNLSLSIVVENRDVNILAFGGIGTGRTEFRVEKKFILGQE